MNPIEAARLLAEAGVPLFLAKSSTNSLGFTLPAGWERTKADPSVVDEWREGMALCAVMGHAIDAIDVDPRNGGSLEALKEALGGALPTVYGVQNTPSGGQHYLISALGVRKAQSVVAGVDIQAGNPDGVGRGFIFLAPTVRPSKETGETTPYTWEQEPDLDMLVLGDDSGHDLRNLVESHHGRTRGKVNAEGSYDGPLYSELDDAQRSEADEVVEAHIAHWRRLLEDAVGWPDGHRDSRGRGWEALAFQSAWALAKLAACPWAPLDELDAALAYDDILPPELAENERCMGKWTDSIVDKAEAEPVDIPPWVERGDALDDFGSVRPPCDVTSEATAREWITTEVGRNRLSGMFRRNSDMVYTPRVEEEGYKPPTSFEDNSPSQVRRVDAVTLAAQVDNRYRVFKTVGKDKHRVGLMFDERVSRRALADLDFMPNLKYLKMVTHTPIARADGTVLDAPGFDEASGVLYLPERGLDVKPVPEEPTAGDLAAAKKLILSMVQDFPWATEHDRANYLGCLMIPLIRAIVPPPYKLLIIGAPQRGSGKSLLAQVMRQIHGGVFRSEIPRDEAELKKVILSILDGTSAPIVQFDNVSGGLKSSTMDGLLTSDVFTERRLGGNVNVTLPNDRLWVVTGNNVAIGGDMDRRVLWTTIDAEMEKPELRPADTFAIPNLESWVNARRGDLLSALLTLVRAWVVAGRPMGRAKTSDSFSRLLQVIQGILDHAGIPGIFSNLEAAPEMPDPEAEEWSTFLQEAQTLMGDKWWTSRELIDMFEQGGEFANRDALPGDLADKLRHQSGSAVKSLGKMLAKHRNQVSDGRKVTSKGGGNAAMKWQVVTVMKTRD